MLRAAWEAVQRGAEWRKGGQRGEREEGERRRSKRGEPDRSRLTKFS